MKRIVSGVLLGILLFSAPFVFGSSYTRQKTWSAAEILTAADLNAEFDAIKTSVDDNNTRITTLEAASTGVGNIYEAVGTTDISTTSSTFVDMTDMTVTQTTAAGDAIIMWQGTLSLTAGASSGWVRFDLDGSPTNDTFIQVTGDGANAPGKSVTLIDKVTLTAASHTVKVQWRTNGTLQQTGSTNGERVLIAYTLN